VQRHAAGPIEVRATASGFCSGFATPTLIGTVGATPIFVVSPLLGPETKGRLLAADITLLVDRRSAA